MHDTPDTIQFLFNLEEVLIERKIASSIHGVKRPIILFFVNCFSKGYTEFQFKEPFYHWVLRDSGTLREMHKKFQHETPHLEWKHLLSKACDHLNPDLETDAFTWDGTTDSVGSERGAYSTPEEVSEAEGRSERTLSKVKYELLRKEVSVLQKEVADLKNEVAVLRDELQQIRSEHRMHSNTCRPDARSDHTRVDLTQDAASHQHYKLIVQSVTSKHPFIRARQRVALCILYISGFNIPKLLSLTVVDLNQILLFVDGNPTPTFLRHMLLLPPAEAEDLLADLQEEIYLLIDDCPDDAPAFRNVQSYQPCRPDVFTRSLNHILEPWKLSTKSWSALAAGRPTSKH